VLARRVGKTSIHAAHVDGKEKDDVERGGTELRISGIG
jgi:hypothetical protein